MPLLDENVESIPEALHSKVPGWLFEYNYIGYQYVGGGCFIYRLPTIRECQNYHLGYRYDPINACVLLLDRILLAGDYGALKPHEVGNLMLGILSDHFPRDEKTFDKINTQEALFGSNLVHIMETYLRLVGEQRHIWDMNIEEATELIGLAQATTGQKIDGSNEKSNIRTRRQPPRVDKSAGTADTPR